ncbi:ABC-F family ATP-binding cassette domain-containing protein [Vannielia litorea]|uniref:ABC-F family ATP-binding cassette domain-containing protein n=1 Tax=Vannielia litorea TaxID=1217970 RepID=UPI001BCCD4C9|nr:ATP-binding cassette domain-containing protein [Vannielia litorea]MBS8228945.1 ATP-binding cassette domain-containing protein [Vannielia litorea]
MARAPLLQLSDISLTFGGNPVFDGVSLTVQPGDRVALVGRNGSGKSTLMKVMAGLVEPDAGEVVAAPGVRVGYMEQEPTMAGFATLGEFAVSGLDESEAWRVEAVAEGLKFGLDTPVEAASGGERRRAALAKLLAEAPELMLLDEPTNHLDIEAIAWLERELSETRAGFVLISHDRAFLTALTRATLWIDRGEVRRQEQGFAAFEAWRDKTWEEEDTARHKLNRKIKAEARWAVEGISARRKRNMGRVRALQELRAERAGQVRRKGVAALELEEGTKSGKVVLEAQGIAKRYGEKLILRPFDIKLTRGERVAFVGPNGAGKTTLINMLIGKTDPDEGRIKMGHGVEMAVFDQSRAALDPDASLWENLAGDPAMRVSGQADQVMVRGQPRHVVGYLKDFLFDEAQARAPVRSLSGGEKARLLLARLMARESNLMVLDEPTNDLDIETLDLLQEVLSDYPGTVLLVSHDRDFVDRVATRSVVLEGEGRATIYAGGWSDLVAQGGGRWQRAADVAEKKPQPKPAPAPEKAKAGGLSFTEKHRLEALPAEIERLEAEIGKLTKLMSDPELFTREPVKFRKATEALTERQARLEAAEEEWLVLEEKAAG